MRALHSITAAAIALCALLVAGPAAAQIKIGSVLSVTGPASFLGDPEKRTLEIYVDEINAKGGVNGQKLQLVVYDDAGNADNARTFATRLVEEDKVVAMVGGSTTGSTLAMIPVFEEAQIPFISLAGAVVIVEPVKKWVFKTPHTDRMACERIFLDMRDRKIERIGLISGAGGFDKSMRAECLKVAGQRGVEIVADETYGASDTDMTPQLTKIRGAGVEAVILWNAGTESAIVAKNMKQLGMTVPLIGSHGNARMEFITGAGPAAEGFTFAAGKILKPEEYGTSTEEYKVAEDFITRFTDATGAAPDTFAGHAYDAFNITVEAMKRLPEGFTPADLRDEIEKTKGFIGIGGTFTFSATDHNGLSEGDLVMYKIENGAWTVVK